MIQPEEILEAVRNEHLLHGESFTLAHAARVIETVYANREEIDDDLEPSLVIVAGKFYNDNHPRFDVGIYPSFSFYQPIEILFSYPLGWRNWTLNRVDNQILEFSPGSGIDTSTVHNSKWFRRYSKVKPSQFVCRMRSKDELKSLAESMAIAFKDGL